MTLLGLGCANDLSCPCRQRLGVITDYDVIIIGGKKYSAKELYEKTPTVFAGSDVRVYSNPSDGGFKYVTKAGNPIGKYYSYLLPTASRPDGWIELQTGPSTFVFVKNEALSKTSVADQGLKTLDQQVKEEQDQADRDADPYGYYLKKYGLPALLIGGGIYLVATYGKEFIKDKIIKAA